MYDIRFVNDYDDTNRQVVATKIPTLCEARRRRQVSGDLVFYHQTNNIVTDPEWLFDWEKQDERCYAQKRIRRQRMKDLTKDTKNTKNKDNVLVKIVEHLAYHGKLTYGEFYKNFREQVVDALEENRDV
jgi:hypothetical protein